MKKTNRTEERVRCWNVSYIHEIRVPRELFGVACHTVTNIMHHRLWFLFNRLKLL